MVFRDQHLPVFPIAPHPADHTLALVLETDPASLLSHNHVIITNEINVHFGSLTEVTDD